MVLCLMNLQQQQKTSTNKEHAEKKIQALEHPNMQHMQCNTQHIDTPQIDTLEYIQCVQHTYKQERTLIFRATVVPMYPTTWPIWQW
jgi:ferritin